MGWTSYYTANTREYEVKRIIDDICEYHKSKNLKCVDVIFKGAKCFYLLRGDKGDFIDLMLTELKNGEFSYKIIGLTNTGDYKYHDIPKSLLRQFQANNNERKNWLNDALNFYAEKAKAEKAKGKFKIGEIYKVAFNFDISWGSVKIAKGKEFLIEVCKKPFTRKNLVNFVVLDERNGDYFQTNYALMRKTLLEANLIKKVA